MNLDQSRKCDDADPAILALRERLAKARIEIHELQRKLTIAELAADEPLVSGKPIIDRVYDLLRSNPDVSFSPAEVLGCIGLPLDERAAHSETVRKSLQRLVGRGGVDHAGRGTYQIITSDRHEPCP